MQRQIGKARKMDGTEKCMHVLVMNGNVLQFLMMLARMMGNERKRKGQQQMGLISNFGIEERMKVS